MFSQKIEAAIESKYAELCGQYRQALESQGLTLGWVLEETQIERVHSNLCSIKDAVALIREEEEKVHLAEQRAIALIMGI